MKFKKVMSASLSVAMAFAMLNGGIPVINADAKESSYSIEESTQTVTVKFVDGTKDLGSATIEVAADETRINTNDIVDLIPNGYGIQISGDIFIEDGIVIVELMEIDQPVTEKTVTVYFRDEATGDPVKEVLKKLTVDNDETHINTSDVTAPEGYEFTITGDYTIEEKDGEYFIIMEVRQLVKEVKIMYVDIDTSEIVWTQTKKVATVEDRINTNDMIAPRGYEIITTGDYMIGEDGSITVNVKSVIQRVKILFIDGDKEVGTASINVATDETKINTDLIKDLVPNGYEIQITGDLLIENGVITVQVKEKGKPITEKTVTVYFINEKDNTPLAEWTTIKVAEDEVHVNTNDLTAPDGYEFTITGDYLIKDLDGKLAVYVMVKEVEEIEHPVAEKTVTVYFINEKDNTHLAEWTTIKVAEDEVHVNTNDLTAPDGYEFTITGDYLIKDLDGKLAVYVMVKEAEEIEQPNTEKEVIVYFIDEKDNTQLEEWTTVTVAGDEVHVNTNDLIAPEGYEFAITGDYFIEENDDGEYVVYVSVRAIEEPNNPEEPTTPSTPDDKNNGNKENNESNGTIATGDNTMIAPIVATFGASLMALAIFTFLKKNKQVIE